MPVIKHSQKAQLWLSYCGFKYGLHDMLNAIYGSKILVKTIITFIQFKLLLSNV